MHIDKEEKEGVIKVGKAFCDMQLKSMIDAGYKPQPFDEKTAKILASTGEQQEHSIQRTIDFKSRLQNFKQADRPWSNHVEKTIDRLLLVKGEVTQNQIDLCLQWQKIKSVDSNPEDRLREFVYAFLASPLAEPVSNQQEINFSKETRKEINLLKNLPGLYETTPDFAEEFNNQRMPSLQRA